MNASEVRLDPVGRERGRGKNPVNSSSPTSSGVAEIYCKNYCGLSESVLHVSVDQNSSRTRMPDPVDLLNRGVSVAGIAAREGLTAKTESPGNGAATT